MEHVIEGCQCGGKRCRGCDKTLCKGCFAKHKRQREGLNSRCRTCQNSYLALYRQKKGLTKKAKKGLTKKAPARQKKASYIIHPDDVRTKKCNECNEEKPSEAFWRSKNTLDGLREACKICLNRRRREAYAGAGPEYSVALALKRQKYKEQIAKNSRKGRIKKYNMSIQDYLAAHEAQDGKCMICGNPETATSKGVVRHLAVDHDHQTGQIRGLLCHRCNLALGQFRDDINLMEHAIAYLRSYQNSLEVGDVSS